MAHWETVDNSLDQIITLAASLKGHVGNAKGAIDLLISEKEQKILNVHSDLETLQKQLESTALTHGEERRRLELLIEQKEAEQQAKVAKYDADVKTALEQAEAAEREVESHKANAAQEKKRIEILLGDLEEDAHSYSRLRPSKAQLSAEDIAAIRQLFLSNAAAGVGKLSFSELQHFIRKYEADLPEGALKKLFQLVEQDTKGRMSYITMIAVANDLVALVGDFRAIDANNNNSLSRKEFRAHYEKLGFHHRNTIDQIFRFADEDESDEVTFHEYIHLSLALLVLRILFTAADFDKSGKLDKNEVLRILSDAAIPSESIKKFNHRYAIVDEEDTGSLNYNEFVLLVLSLFADD